MPSPVQPDPVLAPAPAGDPPRSAEDAWFRALFEREFDYVWHTLRRLGVSPSEIEDVTHDVFVTVYRKRGDYDPGRPLRPWLFGIAYRLASDHRKLARHRREVLIDQSEGAELADLDAPAVDQALFARQRRELVEAALEQLDLDRRAVLVLHDLDGCAMPEIAEQLSIPLNTAYSRLRLGRKQLRDVIERLQLRRGET